VRRLAQLAFTVATLVALGLAVQQHGSLPARVATHFGADGQPNGWMSRTGHTLSQTGTTVFIAGLFFILATQLPRVPDRFVNLPHRDYWLAPPRRAETFAWLGSMLFWLGALLQTFLSFVFREVWRTNTTARPELHLNSLWLQVSLFILTAGLVITLLFRFRRPGGAR
jgi:uncharacterized membrane protein YedE/YeeE